MVWILKPPEKTRTSRMYFLKKIHKNPLGIRPIVSSYNRTNLRICTQMATDICTETNVISERLNRYLIETLTLPDHCLLASIDVSSLYYKHTPWRRNIVLSQNQPYKCPEHPSPEVLSELISIVLKTVNSNLMRNTIYKSKVQHWGPKWPWHMQIYLWVNSRKL